MKHVFAMLLLTSLLAACGGNASTGAEDGYTGYQESSKTDDGKGVGEIKSVSLNDPLQPDMVARGKAIYEMKCSACHKLTEQRVVGPGFKGVTERRRPEWIMNMITNVEVMLEEDPTAQALLEECLTRMPNQNLSVGDARDVLEFLYHLDQSQE